LSIGRFPAETGRYCGNFSPEDFEAESCKAVQRPCKAGNGRFLTENREAFIPGEQRFPDFTGQHDLR
jgi:hypothetical protein